MSDVASNQQIAEAYLLHYRTRSAEAFWAFDELTDIVDADPLRGWEITRLLVHMAKDDAELAYVAAGPLEDLLKQHGMGIIDRVETEGRQDSVVRRALSGVWLNESYPVFARWLQLMRVWGFVDGTRVPL